MVLVFSSATSASTWKNCSPAIPLQGPQGVCRARRKRPSLNGPLGDSIVGPQVFSKFNFVRRKSNIKSQLALSGGVERSGVHKSRAPSASAETELLRVLTQRSLPVEHESC